MQDQIFARKNVGTDMYMSQLFANIPAIGYQGLINRLALKSGIDGQLESPQVGHSRPANTSQLLNSVYVVASSD